MEANKFDIDNFLCNFLEGTWHGGGLFELGTSPDFDNKDRARVPDDFKELEEVSVDEINGRGNDIMDEEMQYWCLNGRNAF